MALHPLPRGIRPRSHRQPTLALPEHASHVIPEDALAASWDLDAIRTKAAAEEAGQRASAARMASFFDGNEETEIEMAEPEA